MSSVADKWRGQAVSLYMLAMRGGASLGSLLTGLSVDRLGPRMALAISGAAACALLWFIVGGRVWSAPLESTASAPRLS